MVKEEQIFSQQLQPTIPVNLLTLIILLAIINNYKSYMPAIDVAIASESYAQCLLC